MKLLSFSSLGELLPSNIQMFRKLRAPSHYLPHHFNSFLEDFLQYHNPPLGITAALEKGGLMDTPASHTAI